MYLAIFEIREIRENSSREILKIGENKFLQKFLLIMRENHSKQVSPLYYPQVSSPTWENYTREIFALFRYASIATKEYRSRKTGIVCHPRREKKTSINCPPIELRNVNNNNVARDEIDGIVDYDDEDFEMEIMRSRWHTVGPNETHFAMSQFQELRLRSQSCLENVSDK